MARATIAVDTSEVTAALAEIGGLMGNGSGLPEHLEKRIRDPGQRRGVAGLVEIETRSGKSFAVPGPELLCIAAELRAIRAAI